MQADSLAAEPPGKPLQAPYITLIINSLMPTAILWDRFVVSVVQTSKLRLKYLLKIVQQVNKNSQLAQMVKNLPAMQETWVQSLG